MLGLSWEQAKGDVCGRLKLARRIQPVHEHVLRALLLLQVLVVELLWLLALVVHKLVGCI